MYGQVFKVLKPGASFVTYEWVATPKFDANNPEHVKIMDEINYGNGLPVRREGGGCMGGCQQPGAHRGGLGRLAVGL